MKKHLSRVFPLIVAGCALLLANCASTIQSRIQKNPERYADLPERHKSLVSEGRIAEGMSKDAVYIAMGSPDGVAEGQKNRKRFEAWRYHGYRPVVTNHIGIGFGSGYGRRGYGRYGRGYGYCPPDYLFSPEVHYVPYTAAVVNFQNGRVKSWESARQRP